LRRNGCSDWRGIRISGWDYTYVQIEDLPGRAIRDTVIHELLHLRHPSWPHWRVRNLAGDLARGRSGTAALSARTEFESFQRIGFLPRDWPDPPG
jgi:hypothetical protein